MKITEQDIINSTIEAVYWWNRDEHYYYQYFSRIDKIYEHKQVLEFFTAKIFEVFLKDYSIRRNLAARYKSVDIFINELFEFGFIHGVKNNNIDMIDEVSEKIKTSGNSTKRGTKSLLSKVAFLINPSCFSLYDNFAKTSLWHLIKKSKVIRKYDLEMYSIFYKQVDAFREEIKEDKLFETSKEILNIYKETDAYDFFTQNEKAFELRIVDKYLWMTEPNKNRRKYNNNEYINLLRLCE